MQGTLDLQMGLVCFETYSGPCSTLSVVQLGRIYGPWEALYPQSLLWGFMLLSTSFSSIFDELEMREIGRLGVGSLGDLLDLRIGMIFLTFRI